MGLSRDTFYHYKAAAEEDGVETLIDKNRRKPNARESVDEITEETVVAEATKQSAQVKYAQGINFEKMAKENVLLTEDQVQALKKKKDDLVSGEIETDHPAYPGSQNTFYVGA